MLGLIPWRLLQRNSPVNKPGSEWFNAVTNALTTMGIRFGSSTELIRIERPNTNGKNWNIVIPSPDAAKILHRWKIAKISTTSIQVSDGIIHRMGVDYPWATAGGSTADITGINGAQDWIIYAVINGAVATVDKIAAASWPIAPDPNLSGYAYHRIGTITTTGDVITAVVQNQFSDIDEDATGITHRWKAAKASDTTATVGDGTIHRMGVDYSWASATISGLTGSVDWIIYAVIAGSATTVDKVLHTSWPLSPDPDANKHVAHRIAIVHVTADKITGVTQLAFSDIHEEYVPSDASPADIGSSSAGTGTSWSRDDHSHDISDLLFDEIVAAVTADITHDGLSDTAASAAHDGHNDGRYWKQGDSSATCYGTSIGNATTVTVVDLTGLSLMGNWSCDGDFDVLTGHVYKHAGNSGVTVANWTGGGIVTGTLVEKAAGDLAPTDKLLVRV